jgi:hypothetical protein
VFELGIWKQPVPITSKSSNFMGETQRYVVKLSKSVLSKNSCTNSSPVMVDAKVEWFNG